MRGPTNFLIGDKLFAAPGVTVVTSGRKQKLS